MAKKLVTSCTHTHSRGPAWLGMSKNRNPRVPRIQTQSTLRDAGRTFSPPVIYMKFSPAERIEKRSRDIVPARKDKVEGHNHNSRCARFPCRRVTCRSWEREKNQRFSTKPIRMVTVQLFGKRSTGRRMSRLPLSRRWKLVGANPKSFDGGKRARRRFWQAWRTSRGITRTGETVRLPSSTCRSGENVVKAIDNREEVPAANARETLRVVVVVQTSRRDEAAPEDRVALPRCLSDFRGRALPAIPVTLIYRRTSRPEFRVASAGRKSPKVTLRHRSESPSVRRSLRKCFAGLHDDR